MQEKGLSADEVEGVGLGVPGPVLDSSIVPIVCANLGGWGNRNVSIELSELLGGIRDDGEIDPAAKERVMMLLRQSFLMGCLIDLLAIMACTEGLHRLKIIETDGQ